MKKEQQPLPESDTQQSAREIAEHVTAILNHPDTPRLLTEGILDGLARLDDNSAVNTRVGYVEAILLTHYEGGAR